MCWVLVGNCRALRRARGRGMGGEGGARGERDSCSRPSKSTSQHPQKTRGADDPRRNLAPSLRTDLVSAQTCRQRALWAAARGMDVPHEADRSDWSSSAQSFPVEAALTLTEPTHNFTRVFPALLVLSDLVPACWDFLVLHRAPFVCSAEERRSVFFPPGVVRFKEGVMQVLGWTIVLLCQWILRKVSSYHDGGGGEGGIFTLQQRCALCVCGDKHLLSPFQEAEREERK